MAFLVLLQATLTLALSGPPTSLEYLPVRVAGVEGEFARQGLQVSIRPMRSEPEAAETLARGQAELAATSLEAALRFGSRNGRPPRLVFGLTAAPPVALLIPAATLETVREVTDLAGRRVGISSPGASEQSFLMALLGRAHLTITEISLLSLGERGVAAALARGTVDAGLVRDPWAHYLVDERKAHILADFRRQAETQHWLGAPTVHAGLFVRAGHGPTDAQLAALARALLSAIHRLETAPPRDLLTRLPPEVGAVQEEGTIRLRSARELYLPDGWVEPEAISASVAMVRARAPLPRTVILPRRPRDLLLLDPLRMALGRPGMR
ncbi:MAG: ABC transporter substrate-binding protein [Candidatus Methylomirabilia bacterium]